MTVKFSFRPTAIAIRLRWQAFRGQHGRRRLNSILVSYFLKLTRKEIYVFDFCEH